MKDFLNIEHFKESVLLLIFNIVLLGIVIFFMIPMWDILVLMLAVIQWALCIAEDKENNWNLASVLITFPCIYLIFLILKFLFFPV